MYLNNSKFETSSIDNNEFHVNLVSSQPKFKRNNPKLIKIEDTTNKIKTLRKSKYYNKISSFRNDKLVSLTSNTNSSYLLDLIPKSNSVDNVDNSDNLFSQGLISSKSYNINQVNEEILKHNNIISEFNFMTSINLLNLKEEIFTETLMIKNIIKAFYDILYNDKTLLQKTFLKTFFENKYQIFIFKAFNFTCSYMLSIWNYFGENSSNQSIFDHSIDVIKLKKLHVELEIILSNSVTILDLLLNLPKNAIELNFEEEFFEFQIHKAIVYLLNNYIYFNDEKTLESLVYIVSKLTEDNNEFRDVFINDFDLMSTLINLCCINEDLEQIRVPCSKPFVRSLDNTLLCSTDYSRYTTIMSYQEKLMYLNSNNNTNEGVKIKNKQLKYNSLLCICSVLGCQPTPKLLRVRYFKLTYVFFNI